MNSMFKFIRNLSYKVTLHIVNLRIIDWKAYLSISILGSFITFTFSNFNPIKYILFLALISAYLAFSFSINNVFDKSVDSIDKGSLKKNPVACGKLNELEALILSISIPFSSIPISFLTFGEKFLLLYSFSYLISTMYSVPPFRLKSKPILDIVSHGIFFGVLPFMLGMAFNGSINFLGLMICVAIFFYSINFELRNHLEDYEFDLLAGIRTTAVVLGKKKAEKLKDMFANVTILWIIATAIVLKLYWPLVIISSLLTLCNLLEVNKDRKLDLVFILSILTLTFEFLLTNL